MSNSPRHSEQRRINARQQKRQNRVARNALRRKRLTPARAAEQRILAGQ